MNENLRQVIHDYMAQTAAQHAATIYPGIMDGDTARQLFALLCTVAQDEDHGVIDGEDVRE